MILYPTGYYGFFRRGNVKAIQYLAATRGKNYAVRMAAAVGNLEIINYLVRENARQVDDSEHIHYAVAIAAQRGNLQIVKYLVEESGLNVDITAKDNLALKVAALGGHLHIIRFFVEESGQHVDITAEDHYAIQTAANNGHLDSVRYLAIMGYGIATEDRSDDISAIAKACLAITHEHIARIRTIRFALIDLQVLTGEELLRHIDASFSEKKRKTLYI